MAAAVGSLEVILQARVLALTIGDLHAPISIIYNVENEFYPIRNQISSNGDIGFKLLIAIFTCFCNERVKTTVCSSQMLQLVATSRSGSCEYTGLGFRPTDNAPSKADIVVRRLRYGFGHENHLLICLFE
jgi:hypothetical protein